MRPTSLFCCLFPLLLAGAASAAEANAAQESTKASENHQPISLPYSGSVAAGLGIAGSSSELVTLSVPVSLLMYLPHATVGAVGSLSLGTCTGAKSGFIGGAVGPAWDFRWGRLQVMGEFGGHDIGGIGNNCSLFGPNSTTPSPASAWLPAVGLSAGVVVARHTQGSLVPMVAIDLFGLRDLTRPEVNGSVAGGTEIGMRWSIGLVL